MDVVFFDNEIIKIFGKAMGFTGIRLDIFVNDYSRNLTILFVQSALEHIGEIADPEDMEEMQKMADEFIEEESDDLTPVGEFLGKKLLEYPQAAKKVDKEVSDFNAGVLSDFLARAPQKYIAELMTYLNTTIKTNKRVGEMIERIKKTTPTK